MDEVMIEKWLNSTEWKSRKELLQARITALTEGENSLISLQVVKPLNRIEKNPLNKKENEQ